MNAPSGPIFDANLRRLLKRAYVPARPAQRFRQDLWAEVEAALPQGFEAAASGGPRAAGTRAPRTPIARRLRPLRRLPWLVAAAAALVLLLPWLTRSTETRPDTSSVASLTFELRTAPNDAFRSASRALETAFVWDTDYLELRSTEAGLVVERALDDAPASALALHLDASTHVQARSEAGEPRIEVLAGSLQLVYAGSEQLLRAGDRWPDRNDRTALAAPSERESVSAEPEPLAATESTADTAPRYTGRVLDAATGEPVQSFRVYLLPEQDYSSVQPPTTRRFESTDGTFRADDLPAGRYSISVSADGYALWRGPELIDFDADNPELEVRLERGRTLRGYALDARSGAPIANAWVVSESDAPTKALPLSSATVPEWIPASTHTGVDGSFELEHLSDAAQFLRATADGYGARWTERLEVGVDTSSEPLLLELEPGAGVEGRVFRDDGSPWAASMVVVAAIDLTGSRPCMSFDETVTSADGYYAVGNLPAGFTTVVVLGELESLGTRPPSVFPLELEAGVTTTLDVGRRTGGIRLFGSVLDPRGELAPNVVLSLGRDDAPDGQQDWIASGSDANGAYEFVDLQPGSYLIFRTLGMGAGLVLIDRVDLPDWSEVPHDIQLGELEARGTVVDRGGEPVERAFVILEKVEEDGSETFAGRLATDRSGTFSFHPLPVGTYRLSAYAAVGTLAPTSGQPFAVKADAPAQRLVLAPGARLRLTLADADGLPVSGALVSVQERTSGQTISAMPLATDARGEVTLDNLPSDGARLLIRAPESEPHRFDVVLQAGDNDLRLALPEPTESR